MLAAIGAASVDDLFADVPEGVRLGRPLDLPAGKPEQEVYAALRDLAARNVSAEDELTFLGASVYEGPSALAAAGYLARLHHPERTRFLVSRGVHPHSRETLATTSVGWGTTIEELPLAGGATDADALA